MIAPATSRINLTNTGSQELLAMRTAVKPNVVHLVAKDNYQSPLLSNVILFGLHPIDGSKAMKAPRHRRRLRWQKARAQLTSLLGRLMRFRNVRARLMVPAFSPAAPSRRTP